MKAIIEVSGTQMEVKKGDTIVVNRLSAGEGEKVEFDRVVFLKDGEENVFGTPYVEGAKVVGKVLRHLKGRKILVFKYKRKKNYRRRRGHRQYLTEVVIEDIVRG